MFYDSKGEHFIKMFNNVKEIVKYQGKEITQDNCKNINRLLLIAFRKPDHRTYLLDGTKMTVFIVDVKDKENQYGE